MNTSHVLQQLDLLATMKPKEKLGEIGDMLADTTFSRAINFALDPFITFGLNKLPEVKQGGYNNFTADTWTMLERLASRSLTGKMAHETVASTMWTLNPESSELLRRIITKDLRCGVTAKTINTVAPGTIATFECQLAHKYEERHIKRWPVAVEPKYDGMRALLVLESDGARFVSRTGKPFVAMQWLADEIHTWIFKERMALFASLQGMVIDGELVDPAGSFYKIGGARGKSEFRDAHFVVFDVLRMHHFQKGYDPSPYTERRMAVSVWVDDIDHTNVRSAPVWYAGNHAEIMDYYNQVRSDGGEGVVVKPTDGDYRCTRTRNWLKIKDQQTVDVPIVGLEEGTGKYEGMLGAMIVDVEGVEVRVGTGTNFSLPDSLRKKIWLDHIHQGEEAPCQSWEDELDEYVESTYTRRSVVGRMAEIEFHEKTPDGSLRHSRFVRFRDDKPVEDGVGV